MAVSAAVSAVVAVVSVPVPVVVVTGNGHMQVSLFSVGLVAAAGVGHVVGVVVVGNVAGVVVGVVQVGTSRFPAHKNKVS